MASPADSDRPSPPRRRLSRSALWLAAAIAAAALLTAAALVAAG
jgi:hypothetical protein